MMSSSKKIIIFDLDGTLVNAFQAVAESINHALSSLNFATLDQQTIERNVGWGEKRLVESLVAPEDAPKVLSLYRAHHADALKNGVKFLPKVKNVLKVLGDEKYILAIATNRPTRFTEIILKHLKIRSLFAQVLCADKVENAKPAPDILEVILERLQFAPEEALYVGDMPIDVQTGVAAGVEVAAVSTGSYSSEELNKEGPQLVMQNMGELLAILGISRV